MLLLVYCAFLDENIRSKKETTIIHKKEKYSLKNLKVS